jgi:very-short-patch-repair endonuclease
MDWRELAKEQAGIIGRTQLASCGLSRHEIDWLVSNSFDRLHPGVYAHSSVKIGPEQLRWAAAVWSGGVISHGSAAVLWRIPYRCPSSTTTVTVSDGRFRRATDGVLVRRLALDRMEVQSFGGLAVTSRPRTVIDLLRTEPLKCGLDLMDRALQQRWIGPDDLRRCLANQASRSGNNRLRQLIAKIEPGADAQSERLLHRLMRRADLTGWTPQLRVQLPQRVVMLDVGFRLAKVAIEVDGRLYHDADSDRFEDDRLRQNELVACGWVVLRFTWRRLTEDPAGVIVDIRRALQHSSAQAG